MSLVRHDYASEQELRSGEKCSQERLMRGGAPRMARAPIGLRPICVRHDYPKSVSQWQMSSHSTAGHANG
jgi:hypothetical protein